jgi:polyisoprenoid-binding protein YceI
MSAVESKLRRLVNAGTLAACITLSTLALPGSAAQNTWTIIDRESSVEFVAFRETSIPATGRFDHITGSIKYDEKNLTQASVEATIPLASMKTGIDKRDADLKGASYFDQKIFPQASFKSTGIRSTNHKYVLSGEFTLHGVKKKIDLLLSEPVITTNAGKKKLTASATTLMLPSDYSLSLKKLHPDGFVRVDSLEIKVYIKAEK